MTYPPEPDEKPGEYAQARDHARATVGPYTAEEQVTAENDLSLLHADAFALRLRTDAAEDPPTLEEWGAHYRRKAPLLVRLSLADPLRYEALAREALARWRLVERREIAALAGAGLADEVEGWLRQQGA
ncbi:hypothetical protein ACFXEL_31665 [Streptomyces sp. NPDC059382]|uniref:hypothetical protein n=1 Tax=Streptomyces sp. NPDC059382 TaxID=3346816 RepID=UPI0036C2130C